MNTKLLNKNTSDALSAVTVDSPELLAAVLKWEESKRGAPAMAAWDEIIAHIDAHVAAQVAQLESQNADLRQALSQALCAQAAAPVVASESNKLDHECEFLEDWLRTAAEPCGRECCGHGVGGECCGDADPVFMTYPELLAAMQARLKEVTAFLSSQPSPAPVAMTDERIMAIWRKCDQPSEENDFTTGPLPFARAILAAQQEAV